jgi:hypothetical protein
MYKPEGKMPLGRPSRRLVDNIKMDLIKTGRGDVDWIDLVYDKDLWKTNLADD